MECLIDPSRYPRSVNRHDHLRYSQRIWADPIGLSRDLRTCCFCDGFRGGFYSKGAREARIAPRHWQTANCSAVYKRRMEAGISNTSRESAWLHAFLAFLGVVYPDNL